MEKTYQVLKILIVILIIAVAVAGLGRLGTPPTSQAQEATIPTGTSLEESANAAPDFTVYDLDGNPVKLSDFRGKPVILNFWASWCGPCKAEMPDLEAAYLEYGDEIRFLTVNLTDGRSETVESASAYITQQGYTFPVYYDTKAECAYTYGVTGIPMTLFIDKNGDLVSGKNGMISQEDLQRRILTILG